MSGGRETAWTPWLLGAAPALPTLRAWRPTCPKSTTRTPRAETKDERATAEAIALCPFARTAGRYSSGFVSWTFGEIATAPE
jgi:hypothetical protein